MIGPADVKRWAESLFPLYLASIVRGEPFFPREKSQIGRVRAGASLEEFHAAVSPLWAASKNETGAGYTVVLETRVRRSRDEQNEPVSVVFTCEQDYVEFLGCADEVTSFRDDVGLLLGAFPTIAPALSTRVSLILDQHGHWPGIISVVRYFLSNPRPGCYMRALPVPVHTKFVESHKAGIEMLMECLPGSGYSADGASFQARCGLIEEPPPVRLRFADPSLQVECGLPADDIVLQIQSAAKLKIPSCAKVLVCENKMNFLAIPEMPDVLVLWGAGNAAISLIPQLPWIHSVAVTYWGDLDPSGFYILAELRARLPHMSSCNMDEQMLREGSASLRPANRATARVREEFLSADEKAALELLEDPPRGIEQEQLPFAQCVQNIRSTLGVGREEMPSEKREYHHG